MTRHWPALSVLAVRRAAEQERQRVAQAIEDQQRAAEQQATVRNYLDWLATTKAELEAAKKAGDRKTYSAIVFQRRNGAVKFDAMGLLPALRRLDPVAADESSQRAARSDAEVLALVDRTMVKIAIERVTAAIPQMAPTLIGTLTATGAPDLWRTALADALALPNRIESAGALRSLAADADALEQEARQYRLNRASLETAEQTARQAVEAATKHLWHCCRQASRNPEADYPALEARSHTITEKRSQTYVFAPPSGLRGHPLFNREERRQAEQAAEGALPAALVLRKAREAAQAATAKLAAYASGPESQSARNNETALKAVATTLGSPEFNAVISNTLIQAAQALERTAAPPRPYPSAWGHRAERQRPEPQDYSQEQDDGPEM